MFFPVILSVVHCGLFSCIFSLTKPTSFADCLGDELPYGWEQVCDQKIGTYFVNHLTRKFCMLESNAVD